MKRKPGSLDSKSLAGKIQDAPGHLISPESKEVSPQTQMGTRRKDTGTFYLEGTPNGQIGDNWSIENHNGEGLTNLFLQKNSMNPQ